MNEIRDFIDESNVKNEDLTWSILTDDRDGCETDMADMSENMCIRALESALGDSEATADIATSMFEVRGTCYQNWPARAEN